jgi:dihydroflavonol-4-reductase
VTDARRLLVTGATGLLGSCVCARALAQGDDVIAFVRPGSDVTALQHLGARLSFGDITERGSLDCAMRGASAVVHAAALLGGTWAGAGADAFQATNVRGTVNVLDAAAAAGVARTVVVGTIACMQTPDEPVSELSPIPPHIAGESMYASSKREALAAAAARAAAGMHVMEVVPGAIYGRAPATERALVPTSFNHTIVTAVRGQLNRFAHVPLPWSVVNDVADVALRALARGRVGWRYLATGRMEDTMTVAGFLSRACALAGVDERVIDVAPTDDPAFDAEFGSMAGIARRSLPEPLVDNRLTIDKLGYRPTPVDDGLRDTLAWLRELGELPADVQGSARKA